MARRVEVLVLCDPCLERGDDAGGEEVSITLTGMKKARVIAFCEAHRKEYYDPIVELLDRMGQAAPAAAKAETPGEEEPFPCPATGCDKVLKNRASAHVHARTQHDTTLSQLEGKPANFKCDQEGCDVAYTAPQHLSRHLKQVHGIVPANVA